MVFEQKCAMSICFNVALHVFIIPLLLTKGYSGIRYTYTQVHVRQTLLMLVYDTIEF